MATMEIRSDMSLGLFIYENHTADGFGVIVFLRGYCLPLKDGRTGLSTGRVHPAVHG